MKLRVLRRPKLIEEGEESEVLNLETAETSPSIGSFLLSSFSSNSILVVPSFK